MKVLAPIILFVYNRPIHTKKTIEALLINKLSKDSDLFIFSDGYKSNDKDSETEVKKVRRYINSINGFKSINIIESTYNKGLAKSIIEGVNYVFKKYESLITIEDDVIVGENFLEFMNKSLYNFSTNKRIFMISGYLFNLPLQKYKKTNFFLPTGSTQAWATWKDRWRQIDFESKDYVILKQNKWLEFKFNLFGGIKYSQMLINQMEEGNISSWAIRFRWSLFKQNGITLFPARNMVINTGWDGSGNHCNNENIYKDDISEINNELYPNPKNTRVKNYDYLRLILFFYKLRVLGFIKNKFKKQSNVM